MWDSILDIEMLETVDGGGAFRSGIWVTVLMVLFSDGPASLDRKKAKQWKRLRGKERFEAVADFKSGSSLLIRGNWTSFPLVPAGADGARWLAAPSILGT
jgi:hypothetical protein